MSVPQVPRKAHQRAYGVTAYSIAVMSKDESAYRTCNESNEIDAERVERCGQRILVRKEELAEDEASHRAVEEKVIPLDRGSYRRGGYGAAEFATMLVWRERIINIGHGCHVVPP
jgi:hypothetical protein